MVGLIVSRPLVRLASMTPMAGVHRAYHHSPKPLMRIPPHVLESIPKPKRNHSYHTAEASWKGTVKFLAAGLAGCTILTYLLAKALNLSSTAQAAEKSAEEIEAEAIAQKDSKLVKCTGRTPDEFGGYIYHFEKREEHELELDNMDLFAKFMFGYIDLFSTMMDEDLGYRWDNGKLSLPDNVALEARGKLAEKKWPHLQPFNIFHYSGDLDDQTSLEAFTTHDFHLSDGQGFLYDHFYIIPSIYLMTTNARYYEGREIAREAVKSLVDRLKVSKEYFEQNGKDTRELSELKTAIRLTVDGMRVKDVFLIAFMAFAFNDLVVPACKDWNAHCEKVTLDELMPAISKGLSDYPVNSEDYYDDYFFDRTVFDPPEDYVFDKPSFGPPLVYEFLDVMNNEEINRFWQRKYGKKFDSYRLSKVWEICAVMNSR